MPTVWAPHHMKLYRSKSADSGILPFVHDMQRAGFPTCYSCEGGNGHQFDRPTIDVLALPEKRTQMRVKLGTRSELLCPVRIHFPHAIGAPAETASTSVAYHFSSSLIPQIKPGL